MLINNPCSVLLYQANTRSSNAPIFDSHIDLQRDLLLQMADSPSFSSSKNSPTL